MAQGHQRIFVVGTELEGAALPIAGLGQLFQDGAWEHDTGADNAAAYKTSGDVNRRGAPSGDRGTLGCILGRILGLGLRDCLNQFYRPRA
ncbi:MAG: hypothetical protein Fur0042_26960 [Cyanophyceae cyanobacterium]